jgi:hypothetical protein
MHPMINTLFRHLLHVRCLLLRGTGILLLFSFSMLQLQVNAAVLSIWRNDGATNDVTVRIQGAHCRIDLSPQFTLLLDTASGTAYQLLHPAKCYIRRPLAELQANSPCALSSNAAAPIATGRSMVISGVTAYEYGVTNACGVKSLWVAPDYPDWNEIRKATALVGEKFVPQGGLESLPPALPGMIVRTETSPLPGQHTAGQLQTNHTARIATLVSARIVPDGPQLALLPRTYTQVTNFPAALETTNHPLAAHLKHQLEARFRASSNLLSSNMLAQNWDAVGSAPNSGALGSSRSATNLVTLRVSAWNSESSPILMTNTFKPDVSRSTAAARVNQFNPIQKLPQSNLPPSRVISPKSPHENGPDCNYL